MKAKTLILSLLLATVGTSFAERKASRPLPVTTTTDAASQAFLKLSSKKGSEFDKAFLKHLSKRHKDSIKLANLALKNAQHEEIKNLAKKIRANRMSDIKKMQEWQKKWGYAQGSRKTTPRRVTRQGAKSKPPIRYAQA